MMEMLSVLSPNIDALNIDVTKCFISKSLKLFNHLTVLITIVVRQNIAKIVHSSR